MHVHTQYTLTHWQSGKYFHFGPLWCFFYPFIFLGWLILSRTRSWYIHGISPTAYARDPARNGCASASSPPSPPYLVYIYIRALDPTRINKGGNVRRCSPFGVSPSTCSRPELTLHRFPLICRYLTTTSVLYHRQHRLFTPIWTDTTNYVWYKPFFR